MLSGTLQLHLARRVSATIAPGGEEQQRRGALWVSESICSAAPKARCRGETPLLDMVGLSKYYLTEKDQSECRRLLG